MSALIAALGLRRRTTPQHRLWARLVAGLAGALVVAGSAIGLQMTRASAVVPNFDHVFMIMMENRAYNSIIGSSAAPYINSLAASGGSGTNYFATGHPSVGNYASIVAGDRYTSSFNDNCTPGPSCSTNAANITDGIEASGRTWKAYMEDMPSPCYPNYSAAKYVVRHNPFLYFDPVRTNPTRCARDAPYTQLATDLASNTVPNYVWITPNLCNDMHDNCGSNPITAGDTWLSQEVPKILTSSTWTNSSSVLFLTWDEDDFTPVNQVAMVVVSKQTPAGLQVGTRYDHYSALKTIEAAWVSVSAWVSR